MTLLHLSACRHVLAQTMDGTHGFTYLSLQFQQLISVINPPRWVRQCLTSQQHTLKANFDLRECAVFSVQNKGHRPRCRGVSSPMFPAQTKYERRGKNSADISLVPHFSRFNVESHYEHVLRCSKCLMKSSHFPPCFAKHLHHQ